MKTYEYNLTFFSTYLTEKLTITTCLTSRIMMNLIAMANGDHFVLPKPIKDMENEIKIFQITMKKQVIDQSGSQFSIINVYNLEETLPASPLLMLPPSDQKVMISTTDQQESSTKRKVDIEEEHEESQTKVKVPKDLFPEDYFV